jgi:hypothetical protein
MQTKICRECGKELPIDDFYKHSQMGDGHLNKCKECVKSRVGKHRENNIDKIREYDRERGHLPKRQELRTKITKKRRSEVDGYEMSHNAIYRAIENGDIQRSNTCQICGEQNKKTEAHHNDYEQTKKVLWLCPICHRNYHIGKSDKAERIRKIVDLLFIVKNEIYQECDEC